VSDRQATSFKTAHSIGKRGMFVKSGTVKNRFSTPPDSAALKRSACVTKAACAA